MLRDLGAIEALAYLYAEAWRLRVGVVVVPMSSEEWQRLLRYPYRQAGYLMDLFRDSEECSAILLRADGTVLDANARVLARLGLELPDAIGRSIWDWFGHLRGRWEPIHLQALASGKILYMPECIVPAPTYCPPDCEHLEVYVVPVECLSDERRILILTFPVAVPWQVAADGHLEKAGARPT